MSDCLGTPAPPTVPGPSPAAVQRARDGMRQARVLAGLQMLALSKSGRKANARVKETLLFFFSLRAVRFCRSRLFLFQHLQQVSRGKMWVLFFFFPKGLKILFVRGVLKRCFYRLLVFQWSRLEILWNRYKERLQK